MKNLFSNILKAGIIKSEGQYPWRHYHGLIKANALNTSKNDVRYTSGAIFCPDSSCHINHH